MKAEGSKEHLAENYLKQRIKHSFWPLAPMSSWRWNSFSRNMVLLLSVLPSGAPLYSLKLGSFAILSHSIPNPTLIIKPAIHPSKAMYNL